MDIANVDWNNKEEVLEAIRQNGLNIIYASKEIKEDEEVLLEAIGNNSEAIREVNAALLGNKEFMLKALARSNNATNYRLDANPLIYASEELKHDKEFVLEVVKQNGSALRYADYFKKDKDIVIEAVKSNGFALEYADETLRNDKEVVLEAVKKFGYALMEASWELKDDKDVVMAALKQIREETDRAIKNGDISEESREFHLYDIGEKLRQDEEFMKEAEKIMKGQPKQVKEISKSLLEDEDIVNAAVHQHTSEEIAEGINPSMVEIDEVAKEMIEEQTLKKKQEDKMVE